ncbi:pilus assembly protein TadG-related protein [Terricaulis sp.]|uniref:TadE/TadG family type IV pilus assembly protein n=1 Tax=Terricaulis sp. TaxID=2768686 RepID=UPI003784BC45
MWWAGKKRARSFARSRSGNVAMMWALMGAVLLGLIGISVDFTRAQALRAQLQNAADGAVLTAERSSNLTMAQRTAAAKAYFDSEMGGYAQQAHFTVTQLADGGHRVTANIDMPLTLASLVHAGPWNIAVNSEAQASASPPIEVALVLDNTGSMANDMQSLRNAATDLATDLMQLDGDSVSVALVPFVAQVNIGNGATQLAWMDQAGAAPYNGELLEDRTIAYRGSSGTSNCTSLSTLPFTGYSGPYRINWVKNGTRCYALTPEGINYFTLYNLLSNEDWKGCVEARPEPYDISDTAPDPGTPATMFVPFFWLDTTDGYSNSYLTDTTGDITSTSATMSSSNGNSATTQQQREARMFNVFKYKNNSASLDTTPPDTRGPNRGCPTPIVPLTTNDSSILTAISQMSHWNGGGTNQAEGLAWGWRVLSPTAPFTQGRPYGDDVRKVIVLMSDGENTNVGSDPVFASDYSAYNHLGLWRDFASGNLLDQLLGLILHGIMPAQYRRNISNSSNYVTYVNGRESQLCTNIKNAGIEIYTVIFRETDNATEQLMRNCASGNDHFYRADNAAELSAAFDAIGSGIGSLRLTH